MELETALESDEKFIDYMIEGAKLFQKLDMLILSRLKQTLDETISEKPRHGCQCCNNMVIE